MKIFQIRITNARQKAGRRQNPQPNQEQFGNSFSQWTKLIGLWSTNVPNFRDSQAESQHQNRLVPTLVSVCYPVFLHGTFLPPKPHTHTPHREIIPLVQKACARITTISTSHVQLFVPQAPLARTALVTSDFERRVFNGHTVLVKYLSRFLSCLS